MALWPRGFDELIISGSNENFKKKIKLVETTGTIEFLLGKLKTTELKPCKSV